jgi:hypothetical protein
MTGEPTPFRQIRAKFTPTTITVYQAYNAEIADAAVEHQKLNASHNFSTTRMTWIKPSWAWMLYRCGYSYKDHRQERVLAITLGHPAFLSLLAKAVVANHEVDVQSEKKGGMRDPPKVRVQWDPERTVWLQKLAYRSIQIGVPGTLIDELVDGTIEIRDVTERAKELKRKLDQYPDVALTELITLGLVPREDVFEVNEKLREILEMDRI